MASTRESQGDMARARETGRWDDCLVWCESKIYAAAM
jgi:hypothetical protein